MYSLKKKSTQIIIIVTIVIYISLLIPFLNGPAVHRYEQTDIPQYMGTAIKHVELGLHKTFGRDYQKDKTTRYLNHPGLMSVILSFMVRFLGTSNAVARLLPITFNVITLILLIYIAHQDKSFSWITPIIFFSMPIVILYGRDLVIYSPVTLFSLLSLLIYLCWRRKLKKTIFYAMLFLTTFITASFDWIGYLILPLIFMWELQEQKIDYKILLILFSAGIISLGIFLWQNFMITGSIINPVITAFQQGGYYENRIINSSPVPYTITSWFEKQAFYLIRNFTGPVLLTTLAGIMFSIRQVIKRKALSIIEKIAWGTGAMSISYIFLVAPWAYVHSYLHFTLIPAVFLFSLFFFKRLPDKYYLLATVIFIVFSLPVSSILLYKFYAAYL